jgi:hypothetical protein
MVTRETAETWGKFAEDELQGISKNTREFPWGKILMCLYGAAADVGNLS